MVSFRRQPSDPPPSPRQSRARRTRPPSSVQRRERLTASRGRSPSAHPPQPGRIPRRSRRSEVPLPENIRLRLWLVWGAILLGVLGLGYRIYRLQVVQVVGGVNLSKAAQEQRSANLNPVIPRRPIVDSQGNVLAVDQIRYTLYSHPDLFSEKPQEVAAQLAPILEQDESQVLKEIGSKGTGIIVWRDVTEDQAKRIRDLGLDGLDLVPRQQRLYPAKDLLAQVVGYVDLQGQEQTGVEQSFAPRLKRSLPGAQVERMGNGLFLPDQMPTALVYPDHLSLQLTLDTRLQRAATDSLQTQLKKFSAKRGAVIVLNVRDGSILSLVTYPSYNPNRYYDANVSLFRNWAVSDLYEPGSTFKPINVAIALQIGAIQPNDTIYDEGQIQRGGWPIQNHDYNAVGAGGTLTISQVLQRSSNVGMVHIIEKMDPKVYYEWLQKLNIDKPLNTDLPETTPGQLRDRASFMDSNVDRATMAFGQGISLTPLQMAQLLGTLANDGRWIRPHVVKGLVNDRGVLEWQPEPIASQQLFSPEVSHTVLGMMRDVVNIGTAKGVAIQGYDIGGKTGTAQKAENGTYNRARITSFVGVLPASRPQYLVFAVIDEPQGEDAYGSTVAVPIVHQVLSTLISLYTIPPGGEGVVAKPVANP